jgi:hypothetical protein
MSRMPKRSFTGGWDDFFRMNKIPTGKIGVQVGAYFPNAGKLSGVISPNKGRACMGCGFGNMQP